MTSVTRQQREKRGAWTWCTK